MSNILKIKSAVKAIRELKKNGYEAYLVGGAVRDYLLHRDLIDIDITTNAKPSEVSRVFSTAKPTGIKYGTVTIFIDNEQIEVTTYRSDGPYLDNRHPSEVVFGDNVYDDVLRRDFTINGLLMDEDLKVLDFVDGKEDLENKLIKSIGDPDQRFLEDALRILRAVYFQSKLGFQIEKETRNAMERNRNDILLLSRERVLQELLKILKGKYLKSALKTLSTTGIAKILPGLEKGIEFFSNAEEMPFIDVFFTASFALAKTVPDYYPFPNKIKHLYKQAMEVANKSLTIDNETLFTYGLEICLLANRANHALKRATLSKQKIITDFDSLPIRSELDLALRSTEIIELANKKAGAWLKEIRNELVSLVIQGKLKNKKEELIKYLKERGVIN